MKIPQKQKLSEVLEELNEQQRAAAHQTEGPVMVIAGPGTGKTEILAARIGYILNNPDLGDIRPEQILCLTYTDAGAVAMRQRLLLFIGPDAYRVGVYTFHSFCNKVIQEHPEHFGMREMEPISELEEILLLRKLIDQLSPDNPLKRWDANPYSDIRRLRTLFQIIKQEGWLVGDIIRAIDEYLADLPLRDQYIYKRKTNDAKPGDLKLSAIRDETEKMEKLRAAVTLFERYEAGMKSSRRYDFQDMISWVRDAFTSIDNLLLDYQELYQYILVDEYQDTNGSQNQILHLLTGYWSRPNVFVVGDDDQSIYRFQGASVENILDFATRFQAEGLNTIVLEKNYRSSQRILDAAAALISQNTGRLVNLLESGSGEGIKKNLIALHRDFAALPDPPEITEWHNDAHETVGVATAIEALIANRTKPGEIAVIYRKHDQAQAIISYLHHLGIPVQVRRKADLLQSVFSRNVLQIFNYIDRESRSPGSADDMLFEIMHFGFTGITASTIAGITWTIRTLNNKPGTNLRWREYLGNLSTNGVKPDLFNREAGVQQERVLELHQNLENWIGHHRDWTLQSLFERVIINGGLLALVLQHENRVNLLEELNTLFDFVKSETAKVPLIDLDRFMRLMETLKEEEIRLPVNQSISTAEGVNFLTAHGSKGLQFDHVLMIGCDEKAWDKVPANRTYSLPDTLIRSNKGNEAEESRRLFYVAITRARKSLQIHYAQRDNTDKEKSQSRFVAELQQSGKVNLKKHALSEELITEYWNKFIKPPERPATLKTAEEEMAMRSVLQGFQLSVTNLNKYLRCPKSFYYETILRIPSAKNRYMSFGSAVHVALEIYFRRMLDDPQKNWPSERDLIGWFENYMKKHQDSFTDTEYRQDMDRGRKFLPLFVKNGKEHWSKVVVPERNLNNIVFRQVPLRGKLDRIEFEGNVARVFDYKTGKFGKEKFARPKVDADESDTFDARFGGDYWRQAVFYKILVDHDNNNWVAQRSVFEFVEPEKNDTDFKTVPVDVSSDDVDLVGKQIEDTWKGIQALEFDRGCQEKYCRWCNFEKNQFRELQQAVQAEEIEQD